MFAFLRAGSVVPPPSDMTAEEDSGSELPPDVRRQLFHRLRPLVCISSAQRRCFLDLVHVEGSVNNALRTVGVFSSELKGDDPNSGFFLDIPRIRGAFAETLGTLLGDFSVFALNEQYVSNGEASAFPATVPDGSHPFLRRHVQSRVFATFCEAVSHRNLNQPIDGQTNDQISSGTANVDIQDALVERRARLFASCRRDKQLLSRLVGPITFHAAHARYNEMFHQQQPEAMVEETIRRFSRRLQQRRASLAALAVDTAMLLASHPTFGEENRPQGGDEAYGSPSTPLSDDAQSEDNSDSESRSSSEFDDGEVDLDAKLLRTSHNSDMERSLSTDLPSARSPSLTEAAELLDAAIDGCERSRDVEALEQALATVAGMDRNSTELKPSIEDAEELLAELRAEQRVVSQTVAAGTDYSDEDNERENIGDGGMAQIINEQFRAGVISAEERDAMLQVQKRGEHVSESDEMQMSNTSSHAIHDSQDPNGHDTDTIDSDENSSDLAMDEDDWQVGDSVAVFPDEPAASDPNADFREATILCLGLGEQQTMVEVRFNSKPATTAIVPASCLVLLGEEEEEEVVESDSGSLSLSVGDAEQGNPFGSDESSDDTSDDEKHRDHSRTTGELSNVVHSDKECHPSSDEHSGNMKLREAQAALDEASAVSPTSVSLPHSLQDTELLEECEAFPAIAESTAASPRDAITNVYGGEKSAVGQVAACSKDKNDVMPVPFSALEVGSRVQLVEDPSAMRQAQARADLEWVPALEAKCGVFATIVDCDDSDDTVQVEFADCSNEWFHVSALQRHVNGKDIVNQREEEDKKSEASHDSQVGALECNISFDLAVAGTVVCLVPDAALLREAQARAELEWAPSLTKQCGKEATVVKRDPKDETVCIKFADNVDAWVHISAILRPAARRIAWPATEESVPPSVAKRTETDDTSPGDDLNEPKEILRDNVTTQEPSGILTIDEVVLGAAVRVLPDVKLVEQAQASADLEWSTLLSQRCGADAIVVDRDMSDGTVQVQFDDGCEEWFHVSALAQETHLYEPKSAWAGTTSQHTPATSGVAETMNHETEDRETTLSSSNMSEKESESVSPHFSPMQFSRACLGVVVQLSTNVDIVRKAQRQADLAWSPNLATYCGTEATIVDRDESDSTLQLKFSDGQDEWLHISAVCKSPNGPDNENAQVDTKADGGAHSSSARPADSALCQADIDEKVEDLPLSLPRSAAYFTKRFREVFGQKMQELREHYVRKRRPASLQVQWYNSLAGTAKFIQMVWRRHHVRQRGGVKESE